LEHNQPETTQLLYKNITKKQAPALQVLGTCQVTRKFDSIHVREKYPPIFINMGKQIFQLEPMPPMPTGPNVV